MITRSKLVEQLRDYQLRSQHKWAKLTFFSPKPQIITRGPLISGATLQHTRADVAVALLWALLFTVLVMSTYIAFHFRHFKISIFIICLGILLSVCLNISRQRRLAKKRERRLLLPLSM